MKAWICPFCNVVSVVPHESQQACIQALQIEIERTRQVLECTEPLIDGTVRPRRWCASSGGNTQNVIGASLRCAVDS